MPNLSDCADHDFRARVFREHPEPRPSAVCNVIDSEPQRFRFAACETRWDRADLEEGLDQTRTAQIGMPNGGPDDLWGYRYLDGIDFDEVGLWDQ